MQYGFTTETPIEETVAAAKRRKQTRKELAHALGCESRPMRQYASSVFLQVSETDPELVREYEGEIADALARPEPMTCYQALRTIDNLLVRDARVVERAYEAVEACLHEDSGTVRLSAFRVLAHFGATTPTRSEKVWPSLSDAIRCYHGDTEFVPMLNALTDMLAGKVSDQVKIEAAWLFEFDVENSDDFLARKASQIVGYAQGIPGYVPGASLNSKDDADDEEDDE